MLSSRLLNTRFWSVSVKRAFSALSANSFRQSAAMIPHPDKADKGGEDAYFVSDNVLCVADGVGGWASSGVDPAIYSRKLCRNVGELSKEENYLTNTEALVHEAWKGNQEKGSSTLVVMALPKTGSKIFASYVGDCSFTILRKNKPDAFYKYRIQHVSLPDQRQFNFPMQLGWGDNGDNPDVTVSADFDVQDGDIVIAGSDGLFDNLFHHEVTFFLNRFLI